MSALFPILNPTRGKCLLLAGQSGIDMMREKSGGPHLMNLLTTPPAGSGFANYFASGSGYGFAVMCGQGGTSTLKQFAPTNLLHGGTTKYGYWWDEDTGQPGPLVTGQVLHGGSLVTITTLAQAVDYWFTTSGFMSPADVASITDAIIMQGDQDAAAGITLAQKAAWKTGKAGWINAIRSRINPGDPNSVRVHLDQIWRRNVNTVDVGSQIIKEAKIELCSEMTNVTMVEFPDVEVERQVNPLGDDHISDTGMLDVAHRFWQSIINPVGRKRGPSIASASLGAANRIDMPITVESGETLVKPASPCGIRIEVGGSPVVPSSWSWSGNTLQALLPVSPTPGTVKVVPMYGCVSDFAENKIIRYVAATVSTHPYFGRLNLPLRSGLPLTA